jgi:large subunit ribosomal protein L25
MKSITIEGALRSEHGKQATRQLRSEGKVPGVIYGGADTISFSAAATAFKPLVYTPDFQIAEVKVDGKSYRCILKDKQFDVVTDELAHVDMLELVPGKTVIANLPIRLVGQSIGVKGGGRLVSKMKSVKVKTTPENLVEFLEVRIDNLDLNENIRVEDIQAPGMEILNSPRIPVASVVMTRQLKQEEAAAAKEAKKK